MIQLNNTKWCKASEIQWIKVEPTHPPFDKREPYTLWVRSSMDFCANCIMGGTEEACIAEATRIQEDINKEIQ